VHYDKYLRCAASIGLSTTIKYLRRIASVAAINGLGTTTENSGRLDKVEYLDD
jgi:hypothetical protein